MHIDSEVLTHLFEPVVTGLGYELVGVEHLLAKRGPLVRVYIDSCSGITLRDCEQVSQQLSGVLDVENPIRGAYTLEVSSPGLDRPLFTLAHYARFVQSNVKIELKHSLNGRRRFVGRLNAVNGEEIAIVADDGTQYVIPFNAIYKARVVPQFESNKAVRR